MKKITFIFHLFIFSFIACNIDNDKDHANPEVSNYSKPSQENEIVQNNENKISPIYESGNIQKDQYFQLKPKVELKLCHHCKNYHPKCAECEDQNWDLPVEIFSNNENIFPGKQINLIYENLNKKPDNDKPNYSFPSYATAKAPVLYLYSNKERKCILKFDTNKGQLIDITYPKYDPQNGWEFTCQANNTGIIKYSDKKTVPFLYYTFKLPEKLLGKKCKEKGFIVTKENLAKFLREKLLKLGLNEIEITHFILYWYEKLLLLKSKSIFIRFYIHEVEGLLPMNIKIEPKPNKITERRVLMLYDEFHSNKKVPAKQNLDIYSKINRKNDFVIIEWGGLKIPKKKLSKL